MLKYLLLSPFSNERSEAQRGEATKPGLPSLV